MKAAMNVTLCATLLAAMLSTAPGEAKHGGSPMATESELKSMIARFAPTDLTVDVAALPSNERQALASLLRAAAIMDTLYLQQVWGGNETLLARLAPDNSSLGRLRLAVFLLNKGPWSRLDHDRAFLPDVPAKPAAAAFYPESVTKDDVEAWLSTLPEPERAKAFGFFTTIRKRPDGKLEYLPYSVQYQSELELAAQYLREAADFTAQPTLKAYLVKRAQAFLDNDYYASDLAWMELDASIEPTIGPYEVYEDEWFNAKAAFEAFITLRDDKETARLAKFSHELQDIENNLPIEPRLRNPKLGAMAPIRVVNSIFGAGDGNRGVQTAAFNLPNDERITKEKGAKRVMLKNVQQAKFNKVLLPIAKVALSAADQKAVDFEAFFTHILMHELMHGLGPHEAMQNGRQTTVRAALQDTYSGIEEAKADISGLWALQYLIDKGVVDKALEKSMYTTFLASCFRSIRFGINEAHGKGIALQINYLLDAGAYRVAKDGTFSVDTSKVKGAVAALTRELMTLEANGDRAGATDLLSSLAVLRPEVAKVLERLTHVPIDIAPRFVTAEELLGESQELPQR
jgi:hypothetical protein